MLAPTPVGAAGGLWAGCGGGVVVVGWVEGWDTGLLVVEAGCEAGALLVPPVEGPPTGTVIVTACEVPWLSAVVGPLPDFTGVPEPLGVGEGPLLVGVCPAELVEEPPVGGKAPPADWPPALLECAAPAAVSPLLPLP